MKNTIKIVVAIVTLAPLNACEKVVQLDLPNADAIVVTYIITHNLFSSYENLNLSRLWKKSNNLYCF